MHFTGIVVYLVGLAFSEALRIRFRFSRRRSPDRWSSGHDGARPSEMIVLAGIVAGIWLLPGIYAFTSMLDSFNYDVPDYATWIGVILFGAGLVLRWLSHKTLAGMWSGTLEMSRDHHLVTNGIYRHMRHPIYSSLILWSVGQPLLLMNLIAGWSGLIAVALLWVVRVPREEAMMRARFGAEYERYAECTGRIFPRIHPVTK